MKNFNQKSFAILCFLLLFISGSIVAQKTTSGNESDETVPEKIAEKNQSNGTAVYYVDGLRVKGNEPAVTLLSPDTYKGCNRLILKNKLATKDEIFNYESDFMVEKGHQTVSIKFFSSCYKGVINITALTPNGETYRKLKISKGESRTWSKHIFLLDQEDDDKFVGTWTLKVDVDSDSKCNYEVDITSR